jgi:hypothetical protein
VALIRRRCGPHPTDLSRSPRLTQRDSARSKPVDLNVLLQTLARVVNRHYAGRRPVLPTPQQ